MSCHNHRAPFTLEKFDFNASYFDGLNGGLYWGLQGQYYQADGPYVPENKPRWGFNPCTHWTEYVKNSRKANHRWKQGWARGQELAKMHKVDWSKPLRTIDGREVHVVALDYRLNPDDKPVVLAKTKNSIGNWSQARSFDLKTGASIDRMGEQDVITNAFVERMALVPEGFERTFKPNIEATFDGKGELLDVRKI